MKKRNAVAAAMLLALAGPLAQGARAEERADASQLHASDRDGIGYPACGLRLQISSNEPSDEVLTALPELRVTLGQVAEGFVEPRGDVSQTDVPLVIAPYTKYYASALRAISVQITRYLQDEGFESVMVYPLEEQIDPETGHDLRGVGQVGLDLLVRADRPVKKGWFR